MWLAERLEAEFQQTYGNPPPYNAYHQFLETSEWGVNGRGEPVLLEKDIRLRAAALPGAREGRQKQWSRSRRASGAWAD